MFILEASHANDVQRARSVYQRACDLLRTPDLTLGRIELDDGIKFLAQWRRLSSECRTEALVVSFIATCAARMAVLDVYTTLSRHRAVDTSMPYAADDDELDHLWADECALCASFEPPKSLESVSQSVVHAERAWHTRDFTEWAAVAYAVCFLEPGESTGDQIVVDEACLLSLARFERECTWRVRLRSFTTRARPVDAPKERCFNLVDWLKRSTRNANDEVYGQGQQALTKTFMTPSAWRHGKGTPPARLQSWDGEWHQEAFKLASLSYNILKDDCARQAAQHEVDSLLLTYVDYTFKQTLDFSWRSLFFVEDLNCDVTMQRIAAFISERLLNPPPLVLLSMRRVYVIFRGSHPGRIDRVEQHDSFASAFASWCAYVMVKRKGVVFLSKTLHGLEQDLFKPPPQAVQALTAALEELN